MEDILYKVQGTILISDPSVPCIILRQVGFLNGEEFKEVLNKGLELMIEMKKEHGKSTWLVNLIEGDAQTNEDLEWVGTDWNMRVLTAGIRHVAFVLPDDGYTMAQMNAETYAETAQAEIDGVQMTTRMFKDEASAKMWLREVE